MDQGVLEILEKQANVAVSKALLKFASARSNARRFHREAIGDDVDPDYCFGDYLLAVALDNQPLLEKRYGATKAKTALSASGGGPTGGYLVPEQLRDDLMGDVAEEAIIRPRATIIPTRELVVELPYWDASTTASQGVAPFWGGMQQQFTEEGKALPESEPKFRQLSIAVAELGGTLLISGPMMQDARGLEAWLRRAFAGSVAWYEDYAFTNGNGVGQPQGLITAGCAVQVARQTGGQYTVQDGQKMYQSMFSRDARVAVWMFSITQRLNKVAQTNWFVNGPMQQYGLPIFDTLHQPTAGALGDVILVDPSLYVIADREALEVAASPYTDGTVFKQNQWMWRVVERVGGAPWLSGSITVPDGSNTQVSPIVVLK